MSPDDLRSIADTALRADSTRVERESVFRMIGRVGIERFLDEARGAGGAPAALGVILATALSLVQQSSETAVQFGLDESVITHIGQRIDALLAEGEGLDAGRLTFSWLSLAFAAYSTVAENSSGEVEQEALAIARRLAQDLEPLAEHFGEEVADGDPTALLGAWDSNG